jgi:hypothetical protein
MKSLLKSDFGTTLKIVIYNDIYVGAGYVLSHNSTKSIHGKMDDLQSKKTPLYTAADSIFHYVCHPLSSSQVGPPLAAPEVNHLTLVFLPLPRITLASTAATSTSGGGGAPTL